MRDLINRERTSIELLFPSSIYLSEINDKEAINARLREAVLEVKAECDARGLEIPYDYVNSWTSYFFEDVVLRDDPRFADLVAFLQASLENLAFNMGYDPRRRPIRIVWLWANIQYQRGSHRKHFHGASLFSGVYYVDAPKGSGLLKLYDPKETARMAEPQPDKRNRFNAMDVDITPQSGRVVIFPAYLQHEVVVHTCDVPRISLAFNAVLDEGPLP